MATINILQVLQPLANPAVRQVVLNAWALRPALLVILLINGPYRILTVYVLLVSSKLVLEHRPFAVHAALRSRAVILVQTLPLAPTVLLTGLTLLESARVATASIRSVPGPQPLAICVIRLFLAAFLAPNQQFVWLATRTPIGSWADRSAPVLKATIPLVQSVGLMAHFQGVIPLLWTL